MAASTAIQRGRDARARDAMRGGDAKKKKKRGEKLDAARSADLNPPMHRPALSATCPCRKKSAYPRKEPVRGENGVKLGPAAAGARTAKRRARAGGAR